MQNLQNAVSVLARDKQTRKVLSTIYQNIKTIKGLDVTWKDVLRKESRPLLRQLLREKLTKKITKSETPKKRNKRKLDEDEEEKQMKQVQKMTKK